jgi:uncharacterized CHY-type Zn-finger protein
MKFNAAIIFDGYYVCKLCKRKLQNSDSGFFAFRASEKKEPPNNKDLVLCPECMDMMLFSIHEMTSSYNEAEETFNDNVVLS